MGSTDAPTILVTGSTDGLGLAVAERLAAGGANVLVPGRNPQKLERVLPEIASGGEHGPTGYLADLASLDEVRRFARDVAREHERLDVLVNNAGVAIVRGRETSREGYELDFAVNYLAHFLLTLELMPLLEASGEARIVNVASSGQLPIDFADVMLERGWNPTQAYCQSKLAQIMFTFELAERLGPDPSVTATALHPATFMDTKLVHGIGQRPLNSVATGMEATVRLAVADEVAGVTGRYFDGTEPGTVDPQADDAAARRRLWELSEDLTGVGGDGLAGWRASP